MMDWIIGFGVGILATLLFCFFRMDSYFEVMMKKNETGDFEHSEFLCKQHIDWLINRVMFVRIEWFILGALFVIILNLIGKYI